MKTKYFSISTIFIFITGLLWMNSCSEKFLDTAPIGKVSESTLANKQGVYDVLIGAYSLLDGMGGNVDADVSRAISNWSFGSVSSDDAFKGGENAQDQHPAHLMETYTHDATNGYILSKWQAVYGGAQTANDVIRLISKVKDGSLTEEESLAFKAEAIFIRTVFLFEAAKLWSKVPYVDESISFEAGNYYVPNEGTILDKLEADLQFAIQHLPSTQKSFGRVNSWAAKALLGKIYMFDLKFTEARQILTDVIENGVNSAGVKYDLVNFADNFNPSKQNNAETVFAVQMSVNDGANGRNGNAGDALNFPHGGPVSGCCGLFRPSFSLANSYKTDAVTGLPLLDSWDDFDIKNDSKVSETDFSYTPYDGTLDPRIDWTISRRGLPFLDFGIYTGGWARTKDLYGPYMSLKGLYYKKDQDATSDTWNGWAAHQVTANNYNYIRFADVLLLAAEAEIEAGNLSKAQEYVNRIRARAAEPEGFLHTYIDNNNPTNGFTNIPAANYVIMLYPDNDFATQGQAYARKAVRFERKIELAMEGHRFFDLQRWDKFEPGYMAKTLNDYIDHQVNISDYSILSGRSFTQNKNEYYPIPQSEIDRSKVKGVFTLKQNTGY